MLVKPESDCNAEYWHWTIALFVEEQRKRRELEQIKEMLRTKDFSLFIE